MTLLEEFEILKIAAERMDLIQTDVLYRRTDGKPSMKKRVKYIEGEVKEVTEDKPMKSVHFLEFGEGMLLRIKKSKKERKQHLEMLLKLIEDKELKEMQDVLHQMRGIEKGKNILWHTNKEEGISYKSLKDYLAKMKEEADREKINAFSNNGVFENQPILGDDLVLLEGW